jgi:hypothetical protein
MSASTIFKTGPGSYVRYRAEIQILDKIIGGVPKDPAVIRSWLQSRLEMDDRALIELTDLTAVQMKEETGEVPDAETLLKAVEVALEKGNGFKRVNGRLVYEGRCLKAALKEAANIVYPGNAFPGKERFPTGFRKGLKSAFEERVFVEELYLDLGVTEPSGTEARIKHPMTPQGPKSTIAVVDFVEKPLITAHIKVLDDFLPDEVWGRMWETLEQIGIGADRARSDGKFELMAWERDDELPPAKKTRRR